MCRKVLFYVRRLVRLKAATKIHLNSAFFDFTLVYLKLHICDPLSKRNLHNYEDNMNNIGYGEDQIT